MAKTLSLKIVVPDDVEDETLIGYAELLKHDLFDDEAYTGEPAWAVVYTIRPSTEQEAQVLEAQGNNDADDS